LPFSLFETPIQFQNYVLLFKAFQDNFCRVDDIGVPLTLIEGRPGKAAGPHSDARREERLSDAVWLLSLEQLSEFILLEHPEAIANEIGVHGRERCAPSGAVAPRLSNPPAAFAARVGDVV
jgi:hypothetical protein